VNQNGATITGYYTALRTSTGTKISTGYTTKTFTSGMTAGTKYEIELDSYGSCTFTNWQGTTDSGDLTFTAASGPQTLVGVYDCTSAGSLGPASPGMIFAGIMGEVGIPVGFIIGALGLFSIGRAIRVGRPGATSARGSE
jgi:hypothetical protein